MNIKRVLFISFIVLVISSYQTESSIILALLLKVLLLKGALFLSAPLSIGAFMMGQGMGFFSGNMMGGYMMLKAANRYHNKEKAKWSSGSSGSGYGAGGYGGGYYGGGGGGNGWGGWGPPSKYVKAYDKGKDIGSALHALTEHKSKLASALYKVKGFLGHNRPPKGWGWRGPSGGGGGGGYSNGPNHQEYYYTAHTNSNPVTSTKYKLYPYSHWNKGTSYDQGDGAEAAAGGYNHGGTDSGYESDDEERQVFKGHLDYSNYFPAGAASSSSSNVYSSSSGHGQESSVQDPTNTYYTSAYGGPGHEYTGILTNNQLSSSNTYLSPAQSKSSDGNNYSKDIVDDMKASSSSSVESIQQSTISPNPLLEKYLERRLVEEASKQKNNQQEEEAKQLIQMLRKAYMKQLVESLKEEEVMGSVTSSSIESQRDSRSIEDSKKVDDQRNIIEKILYHKFPSSEEMAQAMAMRMDTDMDVDMDSVLGKSVEDTTTTNDPVSSTSTTTISNILGHIMDSSTAPTTTTTTTTTATFNPIESSTNQSTSSTENYVSVSSTESSTQGPSSSTTPTSDYYAYEEDQGAKGQTQGESPSTESSLSASSLEELMEMPAMWVKTENTFHDQSQPFSIRVRRNTGAGVESADQKSPNGPNGSGLSAADTEKQIKSFVDDIKKFFTLLTVLDQDQCLQKLVCDVHTNQKDTSTLTQYEQNILTTFRLMKALMPEGEEDSSTKYRRAGLIGETGQSLDLCQQSYSSCGYSSSQIISLGSQAEATPSDWAGVDGDTAPSNGRSDYVTLMPRVRRASTNLRNLHHL